MSRPGPRSANDDGAGARPIAASRRSPGFTFRSVVEVRQGGGSLMTEMRKPAAVNASVMAYNGRCQ